jgi:hypothetical protein
MASCFSIWYSIFCSAICGDHSSFTKTSATACAAARAEREGRRAVRASARRCGVTGSDGVQRRARRAAHLKLSVDGRGDRAQGGVHRCRVLVGGHGSSEWWAQATSPQPQRRSPTNVGAFARCPAAQVEDASNFAPRSPAGGSQILASLPQHKEREVWPGLKASGVPLLCGPFGGAIPSRYVCDTMCRRDRLKRPATGNVDAP